MGEFFEITPADHCGVEARAHPEEHHSLHITEPGLGRAEVVQVNFWRLECNQAPDRVRKRLRLLHDLLEHEVGVLPFYRADGIHGDVLAIDVHR